MPAAPSPRLSSIIGGDVIRGQGPELDVVYPATEEKIGVALEATSAEVDRAVRSARKAFEAGAWRNLSADARATILHRIHDLILANADELARLECLNTGLTVRILSGMHIPRAAYNFRFFAEVLSQAAGESFTQDPRYLTVVTREPVGVAALIAPWNGPVMLASMKIAAAIAFGNSCVVKPSEFTPLAVQRLIELIHEAGVPPGIVNLVHGRGPTTGAALVGHDEVDLISFTGGTATGRALAAEAGRRLVPVTMELGGKSANVIFEDADIERALDAALVGIYSNNGEQCLAGSRILVQRSIAERFMNDFAARAQNMTIGDPMNPATDLGPLISAAHRDRVLGFAVSAPDEGGRVLCGARAAPGLNKGFYIEPTAVLAPSNRSRIAQEEIFGPVATFLVFDTIDEAIDMANDSSFGLAAYVWTQDVTCALVCSRRLRAGAIWVNTPMMRELRAPFGGYKDSGLGREGARDCLDFYTESKTTSISLGDLAIPRLGVPGA